MRSKFKWIFTLLLAFTMQFSFAQEKTVTGTVTDGKLPLSGANVKSSRGGVSTDADGKFAIKASPGDKLTVTYKGFDSQTITVGAANSYNVKMKEAVEVLQNVMVNGAMNIKRKKEALTSTQQVVGVKELTQAQAPNAIQSLAGKVSGLVINTVANGVSPTTKITLRGNRTLTGNNDALVVIDGAISSAGVLGQLPPEVIESINVIKGAQGAALYGSQGLNGAIIVTTKKGTKNAKMKVTLNSNVDFESVAYMPERQDKYGQGWEGDAFDSGDGNGDTSHIPWENGAWGPAFNDPMFAGTMQPTGLAQADGTYIMSPWESIKDNTKQFFKTGNLYQTGISVNVGGEDSYATFTANRQQSDFVVDKDQLKRNSFMFKAGKKFNKFSIDANVNYISTIVKETSSDLFFELMQTASNIPVGKFDHGMNEHHWTVYYKNPYWKRDHIRNNSTSNTFNGILNLGYKINKNIDVSYLANIRVTGSDSDSHTDASRITGYDYTNALTNAGYSYNGSQNWTYGDFGGTDVTSDYYASQYSQRNYYGDLMFNFNYDLTDNLNLKFNIGNNIQDNYGRNTENGGTNLDIDGWYHINNVLNPDPFRTLSNYTSRSRVVAFFANVDLSYKDYLFLNLTDRAEQSSVLYFGGIRGTNLRNVNYVDGGKNIFQYPSVGVSFIPMKAFGMAENKVLSYAKLYANWVRVGNVNAVGAFTNDYTYSIPTGFPFGNLPAYAASSTQTNFAIEPEYVTTKEFGANLTFWEDRVSLDAAYFIQDTKDLINRVTTSSAAGFTGAYGNIGDLENKGYEVDFGLRPFNKNSSFQWETKVGYSTSKTKVKSLAAGVNSINLQSNTFVGVFAEVGEEFPLIKGTKYVRDPQGNVVVNASGNPIKTSTFEKLGKATPDYILNFSNTFAYKGFRLTAVADYRTGHSIYSETMRNLSWSGHLIDSAEFDRSAGYVFPNSVQQTAPGVYTANTTPVGTNVGGGYAGVLDYYSNNYSITGEELVIDATTFRIRELALSYDLPSKIFSNTGISSLRLGVNARNPFVWFSSKNRNYNDPEQTTTAGNAQGLASIGRYPITRTIGFNINLTF